MRKAAWRLKKAVKQSRRPSIEDYVKTLAARVNLPAAVVKAAVELLERDRRLLTGEFVGFCGGVVAGVVGKARPSEKAG